MLLRLLVSSRGLGSFRDFVEEDWKKFQTFRDRWTKDLHYGWATSWDLYRAPVSFKKKIEIKKAES